MKCFEIQGVNVTPFIMVGRLHFIRVGKISVPLDQSLIDAIPFFGRLKLDDARLECVGDKPTRILPANSIATDGEAVLVRLSFGFNNRSTYTVAADCKVWHGEEYEEVVVVGGPGPMGGGTGMVRFQNYQALVTMQPGQSFAIEETYETLVFPGFFKFLSGVKSTPKQTKRRFKVSYDGKTVSATESID